MKLKILFFALLFLSLISGCASTPKQNNTLAVVDGEPITKDDLEYSLQIAHRREDLSTAKAINIDDYVQKLIDDRLIIQEARRMGMDESPEVKQKVEAYILRESVTKLYNEEIVDKVSVSEEEIKDYYKKNYEQFNIEAIKVDSEEKAREILNELKKGGDFREFNKKYPVDLNRYRENGFFFTLRSLPVFIKDAVYNLKTGEISDVLEYRGEYYIIKLISRQDPPDDELQRVRARIEGTLRKQKIKEYSDEYLRRLRQKANINIDEELLSAITFGEKGEEKEKWINDERPLVKVNGDVLTVAEFVAKLPSSDSEIKEKVLNRWLDRKLVDQEALSRHYEELPEFRTKLEGYKNQLLKNMFIRNVIVPKIKIKDEEVKEYYLSNQDDFVKPFRYKIQQITLNTKEEAEEVYNNLKAGADFAWLARTKSTDYVASIGGVLGWKVKEQLHGPVKEIIDSLEPGDISPVLEVDNTYKIIRLMEKTEKEIEKFDRVKDFAFRAVFRKKFREIYNEYIEKLREEARIEVNEVAVRSFKKIFNQ